VEFGMKTTRLACCALLALLCACGQGADGSAPFVSGRQDTGERPLPDADADGLCDFTEEELGTDPSAADTDGDGLPDVIELVNGLDATDPGSPEPGQVARLEAAQEGASEFEVRATVEGDGQGMSGYFEPLPTAYADGFNAADFFAGSTALSASPEDGVRSIDQGAAHFGAVYGHTRLAFSLRFTYPWEALGGTLDCGRAYPFRYAIKADDGDTRSDQLYLLVVVPEGTIGTQAELCLPHSCQ
jgi:hypothetical protein